jgi:hypothetical protein
LTRNLADLHRLTGVELDVAGPEVQALDRRQQGHGRNGVAEVVDQQRFLADSAIDVLDLVQMGDAGRRRADLCNRLLAADRRQAETIERLDRALEQHTSGSGLSGLPCGSPSTNTDGTSTLPAFFMLAASTASVSSASSASAITLASGALAPPLGGNKAPSSADEAQTTVDLGLDEEHRLDNGLGLGRCQLVDQLGVDITWPWPAPDIGNTLVVDGDDGDPVGRLTRGAGTAEVIKPAFQGSDKVGRLVQDQHRQHDCQSCKPICAPELRILR